LIVIFAIALMLLSCRTKTKHWFDPMPPRHAKAVSRSQSLLFPSLTGQQAAGISREFEQAFHRSSEAKAGDLYSRI
jgi:hypothetical protein